MKKASTCPIDNQEEDVQILLVDDDAIIRMLHQKIVENVVPSLTVHSFKNGEEAVHFIESSRAHNTRLLVLLDINMPVMNGWEFLKYCEQKEFHNLLVVVVSSSINNSDKIGAARCPQVFHYCEKPLNKKVFSEITSHEKVAPLLRNFLKGR